MIILYVYISQGHINDNFVTRMGKGPVSVGFVLFCMSGLGPD